jgi:orotate phosphoribosyltransferase
LVGLDRQEKGLTDLSSSKELEQEFDLKVESIINLDSLITYVENDSSFSDHLNSLSKYRETWGA